MTKRAILTGLSVAVLVAGGAVAWLLTSEAGLRWAWGRAAAWSPGELTAERLEGRLIGPLAITGLDYRTDETRVRIGSLALDWEPGALLRGTLAVARLAIADVEVRHTPVPSTGRQPPTGLRLPLAIEIRDGRVDNLSVQIGDGMPFPITRVRLGASARDRELRIGELELAAPGISAMASGRAALAPPYALDLTLAASVAPPDIAPLETRGSLRGDARALTLEQNLAPPWSARLTATARDVATELKWDAVLTTKGIDLRAVNERWPAVTVAGRIAASGDRARLSVRELTLYQPGTERALDASGQWRFGEREPITVTLEWRNLQWPLAGEPAWRSPTGTAEAHGSLDDYALTAQATIGSAATGDIPLRAQGRGTRQGTAPLSLSARWLEGELAARGELRWQPYLAWAATVRGHDLNPGALHADWPGPLRLQARTEGHARTELHAAATIEDLSGDLRGRPARVTGGFALDGDRYTLDRVEARFGEARLSAAGRVGAQWDINWQATASDLADLWPGARGSVDASGSLRGARQAPRVVARTQARGVAIGVDRIGELRAAIDVDLSDENLSALAVSARDLRWRTLALDELTLDGEGRVREHNLRASVSRQPDRATVALRGGVSDAIWSGTITRADWTSGAEAWQLTDPAGFALGRGERRLDRLCLAHGTGGRLCAGGDWRESHGLQVSAEAATVPLALLTHWFLPETELHGTFGGQAALRVADDGTASGMLELDVGAGELRRASESDAVATLGFEGGRLTAHARDDRIDARAEFRLAPGAEARAQIAAPFTPFKARGADRSIAGRIDARLADLSLLAPWLPQLEQPRGRAQLSATLGGTAEDLDVRGDANLEQGRAGLGALGITLDDVALRARTRTNGHIAVTGHARSGGAIDIDGTVTLRSPDDWLAELTLRGQDFEAIRTPELAMVASPDVAVRVAPQRVDLDGEVRVNRALIAPRALRVGSQASPDVVIVAEHAAEARVRPWAVTSRLRAIVSKQVRVSALNFDVYVEGDVTVASAPETPTVGHGELRVDRGTYRIYGSDLDVERGTLTFTGGPVDNPEVDLRATRRVRNVVAGVNARGPLKTPEITLFSEPPLNQSDIASYIIFGHPTSEAGASEAPLLTQALTSLSLAGGERLARSLGGTLGIEEVRISTPSAGGASLMLGSYLSPGLYVALGVGLFETGNTLRITYDITDRWQIVTDTGVYTGADLLYKIER
jgi:translocation and assembly module TamB